MRMLKIILETVFWMLAAAAAIFGVGIVVGLTTAPVLGYLAAVAVLGFLPLSIRTSQVIRRRRAAMTLSYLEQAVRLNLPLPRMLYAAQQAEPGKLSYRLAQLRYMLEEGYPIGAAVAAAVPETTERETSLLQAAERLGRLPQALDKLVSENRRELRRQSADVFFYRAYPFIISVMLATIIGMVAVFVLPKFETIFKDFNQKLPTITVITFNIAGVIGPYLLAAIVLIVLLSSGSMLWNTFHPTRQTSTLIRRVRDALVWITPVAHGIDRDRGLSDAFDLMADAVAAGTPVNRALNEASQLGVNRALQKKFSRWSQAVATGRSLPDSARAVGMPGLVVGMLSGASGSGASDVFSFLGRYYGSRFSRTAMLLRGAMAPLLVFFFAGIVGCVALATFLPMISLIDSLSSKALGGR